MQVRCRTVPSAAAGDRSAAADNQARGVGSPPGLSAVLAPGFQILGGDGDGGERGRSGKHVPHFAYPALALFSSPPRRYSPVLLICCIACERYGAGVSCMLRLSHIIMHLLRINNAYIFHLNALISRFSRLTSATMLHG